MHTNFDSWVDNYLQMLGNNGQGHTFKSLIQVINVSCVLMVSAVRKACPQVPLVFYINGNGGLLERMVGTGIDVIGLDWTVDMADGRRRLGNKIAVQGNVDPAYLFCPLPALTDEIHRVVRSAGRRGHILNLGHGVLVKTPEEAVAHFFDVARGLRYDSLFEEVMVEDLKPVS
ncbi:hypothetical protein KSP40_PGU016617 [Platanthera guangdongensis]|uniref:Uroporphyrinogen decarboxylase (URO-D) domain-containing protein n=1 Tax=Platanthera guangdongensis TaxID=2320717 RepID=A0ABR2N275_9ASPA